jgi:hypothetical protein
MPSLVEIPLAVSDISEVNYFTVSMATAAILKIPRMNRDPPSCEV